MTHTRHAGGGVSGESSWTTHLDQPRGHRTAPSGMQAKAGKSAGDTATSSPQQPPPAAAARNTSVHSRPLYDVSASAAQPALLSPPPPQLQQPPPPCLSQPPSAPVSADIGTPASGSGTGTPGGLSSALLPEWPEASGGKGKGSGAATGSRAAKTAASGRSSAPLAQPRATVKGLMHEITRQGGGGGGGASGAQQSQPPGHRTRTSPHLSPVPAAAPAAASSSSRRPGTSPPLPSLPAASSGKSPHASASASGSSTSMTTASAGASKHQQRTAKTGAPAPHLAGAAGAVDSPVSAPPLSTKAGPHGSGGGMRSAATVSQPTMTTSQYSHLTPLNYPSPPASTMVSTPHATENPRRSTLALEASGRRPGATPTSGSGRTSILPVPPLPSNLRVLIAEDSAVLQRLYTHAFHKEGIVPLIVGTGREAVQAASRGAFDLILMDGGWANENTRGRWRLPIHPVDLIACLPSHRCLHFFCRTHTNTYTYLQP